MKPRDYQTKFVNDIIRKIADGHKRVLCQLATGAGKTVCFSYLLQRYFSKRPSGKVCILVHREELQAQTAKTLKSFGVINVECFMVETFNNKVKKQGHIHYDLIIIDEAHTGNFRKVIEHYKEFTETVIIGFSATPLSASVKAPLYGDYETIVTGVDVNDLIEMEFLCPAIHYNPNTGIDKKAIKKTGGEYNMASMAVEFSKPKLIDAVVDAYEKYCKGKKTLIF
jgi:superfamily II DNA or RNA helicase